MASEPLTDEWIASYRQFGTPEHLHALGVIAAGSNLLEDELFSLLRKALNAAAGNSTAARVFASLTNNSRLDIIRNFIRIRSPWSRYNDELLYALKAFDICAENRNFLMHSVGSVNDNDENLYNFIKFSRNNPSRLIDYPLTVANLREVAEAIMDTAGYLDSLTSWIDTYADIPQAELGEYALSTFPEKPQQPRKLSSICGVVPETYRSQLAAWLQSQRSHEPD